MEIEVTKHAYERGKDRLGLNKKAFLRLAEKAYELGVQHKESTGRLHKYFDKLYLSHKIANNIRAYGEFLYIFNNHTLITVLSLDNHLKKILKKGGN